MYPLASFVNLPYEFCESGIAMCRDITQVNLLFERPLYFSVILGAEKSA